jgi:hypothetical protein
VTRCQVSVLVVLSGKLYPMAEGAGTGHSQMRTTQSGWVVGGAGGDAATSRGVDGS